MSTDFKALMFKTQDICIRCFEKQNKLTYCMSKHESNQNPIEMDHTPILLYMHGNRTLACEGSKMVNCHKSMGDTKHAKCSVTVLASGKMLTLLIVIKIKPFSNVSSQGNFLLVIVQVHMLAKIMLGWTNVLHFFGLKQF